MQVRFPHHLRDHQRAAQTEAGCTGTCQRRKKTTKHRDRRALVQCQTMIRLCNHLVPSGRATAQLSKGFGPGQQRQQDQRFAVRYYRAQETPSKCAASRLKQLDDTALLQTYRNQSLTKSSVPKSDKFLEAAVKAKFASRGMFPAMRAESGTATWVELTHATAQRSRASSGG